LLPIAALRLRTNELPLRVALFTAAVAGFSIPNVVTYERSWDIVKFFGIGGFFANVLLADTLSVLGARWKGALAALTIVCSALGLFWLARMSVLDGRVGVPKMHFGPPPRIADAVAREVGPLIAPRSRVLSTNMDMGMGAGFLTPGFDWRELGASFMLDRTEAERLTRHRQRARVDLRREDLDGLGADWVILSPGDIASLSSAGRAALADPTRFEHVREVRDGGEVRQVYRVVR
ncbi:hypothetical protein L6R52_36335, partial [Myxococcota bacterium]|nr:hypothetical protein [Myxococcota bacterium]